MDYPICIHCNRLILPEGNISTMDGRLTCACICKVWNVNIITSNSTNADDWNKSLRAMRDWKVTLHGQIDGQKQPVPPEFQDAFKDGELDL